MELPFVPGWRVERVQRSGVCGLTISARSRRDAARCPDCRHRSTAVHGYYQRRPADLPLLGFRVRLELRVRRFSCTTTYCRRRTFGEQLPTLVAPRAQRTRRPVRAQSRIGVALGGETGARLARHLGMPTSAATILRLVRRTPLPRAPLAAVIGVDDWAMRKRQRYGTIIVDLERRCALDLLPDRTADTLSLWLRDRPGITLVARDRSPEYARGIAAGAPDAVQTADRWHLLFNVRQMVDRWAAGAHGRLRGLPSLATTEARAVRAEPFPRTRSDLLLAHDSRARRMAAYDDVRRRYLVGETLLAIARATGLARSSVRKYAYAKSFPERAARAPGPRMIDPYLPYLEARLAEGCENAAELWREIAKRGYAGTKKQVNRWLQERRTTPASRTPSRWRKASMTYSSGRAPGTVPSPKQLAWLITKQPDMLTSDEAAAIAALQQDPEAARVCELVRRFVNLIRSCSLQGDQRWTDPIGTFDRWIADATACGIRAVETFAKGLAQDGNAVRAALTMPWSNRQAEGQITKLKLLKRSMYGRAKLDLLRQRLLLAA